MTRSLILILAFTILTACHSGMGVNSIRISEGKGILVPHGTVVSAESQSSRVGVSILQKGGNAVDAAVATEFALAVCYPEAGNIGGGGFMLVRLSDGTAEVIDYREKAPLTASRNMYLDANGEVIKGLSTETDLAAGVPGTVDGMLKIHGKYGKLPFREVIQSAIDLARNGFPVTKGQAESLNRNRQYFIDKNTERPAFVKDTGWKEGDLLIQPELAETLIRIRDNGRDGFYAGLTAELIVKEMHRGNGIISDKDLYAYQSVFRKPLASDYRGYRIISIPPPSSGGIILLQLLGMIESCPLNEWGFHSVKSVHAITEAERRAFADRALYEGDPDFVRVPVEGLLDSSYLAGRFADFNENNASSSNDIKAGSPQGYVSEETTHYSVVDQYGNAVAATTTLNNSFGSGIVVNGAGFLLNDQMDDFSVKSGVPNLYGLVGGEANSIKPAKRMLSSMTPAIVEKDGKLFLVAGSPGGSTIPTTVFQVIINVIDYHMNISEAVDAGRFHHQWLPDQITYEKNSLDTITLGSLTSMGHLTRERPSIGSVNAVEILPDGIIAAKADKRGDNSACGY
jgi:gamma-glutamyltranspeptidase/glutathione hydrolase